MLPRVVGVRHLKDYELEISFTDGTVDCEHRMASEMIAEACEYLDGQIGESFDDPGYFDS